VQLARLPLGGAGGRAPTEVERESLFGGRIVTFREAPPCYVQLSGAAAAAIA
jgi:hypothetical protein